jgi:hypothetical protein
MNTTTTKIAGEAMTDQNIERLEALAKHFEAGGSTLIGEGMSARYAEAIRALLAREVPSNVMAALDRMCTPLDESVLKGATAEADAHSMKLIRDYVLSTAPSQSCGDAEQAEGARFGAVELILRDVCEDDPADPDLNDTVCINISDLGTIVARHIGTAGLLDWAVGRWNAEVANRPLVNVHRRSLDDTWRQVIRHLGGDDAALIGPSHSELLDAARAKDSK